MGAAKWNADLANEAMEWIVDMMKDEPGAADSLGLRVEPIVNPADFQAPLKSGRLLCLLINRIQPGTIKKISTSNQKFQQLENIEKFLTGCQTLGCVKSDLF